MSPVFKSVGDWIFNRPFSPSTSVPQADIFRSVMGRLSALGEQALPVQVINDVRVEPARTILTGQLTLVANVPLQVVNENPFRRRIRFRNLDPALQYFIGPNETVSPTNGFLVDINGLPSDELVMPFTGSVWIVSTGACVINWMEEV